MKSKTEIMWALAEKSLTCSGRICLEGIENGLKDFVGTDKHHEAKRLVAQAYMANFHSDKRLIMAAIRHYSEMDDVEKLIDLSRIAKYHKNIKAVYSIMQIGIEKGIVELTVSDFDEWLKTGIVWFDLYIDYDLSLAFIEPQDQSWLEMVLAGWADRNGDIANFWQEAFEQASQNKFINPERIALLEKLSKNEAPVVPVTIRTREKVDEKFRKYCVDNGLEIWRQLQVGAEGQDQKSNIYLVRDKDSIFKVFKEVLDYRVGRLAHSYNNEDEVYQNLPPADFLPKYYGSVEIETGLKFARTSFVFSHLLSDYCQPDNLLPIGSVCVVIKKLAEKLLWLYEHNVLYLDLKPDNIMVNNDDVQLLDLGLSRLIKDGREKVDAILTDPKYCAPEISSHQQASIQSIVFQLGIIFHELLTGQHPFVLHSRCSLETSDWQQDILNHFWPIMEMPYNHRMSDKLDREDLDIVKQMLEADPDKRPSLPEIICRLENTGCRQIVMDRRSCNVKSRRLDDTILFPARMGIPHKGHIEFIARLMHLGFKVIISIQRSYTLTDRDPIPKWLVLKIVARSLLQRGFSADQFSFVLTPFYATAQEHRLHFRMMPGYEQIVAIASGNPEVHQMFRQNEVLDQGSVFGTEGKEYFNESWGEQLRMAIKGGDYQSFRDLAADATEEIISFAELGKIYHQQHIEFVSGKVIVKLVDDQGKETVSGRVHKYLTPEQCLIRYLQNMEVDCEIVDLYSRETKVLYNKQLRGIKYVKTIFDGENETIIFQMMPA